MFTGKYLWGKKIENLCNATVIRMSVEFTNFFDLPNRLSHTSCPPETFSKAFSGSNLFEIKLQIYRFEFF